MKRAPDLRRRLAAEFLGSAFLAAIVIGSGIAAQRLSPSDTGLELLENSAATAAGLFAIILMFGPVSGAHFNPVVSLADAALGGISWRDAAAYLPAQVAGCVTGAVAANLMFGLQAVSISAKHRASGPHALSEVIATAGLLLVIFALARTGRAATAPAAVGAYVGAAYWFTASTSFANPAITVGRMFSSTFAGIAPSSAPVFIAAQVGGGIAGVLIIRLLYPALTPAQAARAVVPHVTGPDGSAEDAMPFDQLVIGTGAVPVRPPIAGLDALGPEDGVHLLHSMDDTFAVMRTLEETGTGSAVIVGAGYVGLEMAEGLSARGLAVTQLERLPEVLPTVDPDLGALVRAQLEGHGVTVHTGTDARVIARAGAGAPERLRVDAVTSGGEPVTVHAGLVLVVTVPETALAAGAGAALGARGAIAVDRAMRTGLPDVYAAGDCVITHHRLVGETYLPLGTTAHKQGRVAGENAAGGHREFAGSLGTQVVKVFDQAAARTGLRDHEAREAGFDPVTVAFQADDHKAYYPGSHKIAMRFTGDRATGRPLGVQLLGHKHAEIAKRVDIAATAIYHGMTVDEVSDLDLSYTPPLGSPWDAVQMGAQAWVRHARQP